MALKSGYRSELKQRDNLIYQFNIIPYYPNTNTIYIA